jgi:hypothetical protein
LNSSVQISAVPFGFNLSRLGEVGGAIQRRLSPIRYAAVTMPEQAPELIELIQNHFAALDLQFQYWLTITFAAVVASFLARDQLTTTVRFALAILYVLSVVQIVLVSMAHLEQAAFLRSALADLGVEFSGTFLPAVGLVRRSVLGLGSIAATVFILRPALAGSNRSLPLGDSPED